MDLVDEFGEEMFGRRIRLRVLLWADTQPEAFNQSQASKGVDYSSSGEVAKELERLVRLGMLRKFGRPSRVGPQNYVKVEHPGWTIAAAARGAITAVSQEGQEEKEAEPNPARVGGARTARAGVQGVRANQSAGPPVPAIDRR